MHIVCALKIGKMFDYSNNGLTISLVRRKRSSTDNEIERPICWRVTFKRQQVYYSTGFSFTLAEWNEFSNKRLSKHQETKDSLDIFFTDVLRKHAKNLSDKNKFSFEALDSLLGRSDILSLNDAHKEMIEKLTSQDRINYAGSFKNSLRSIEKYYNKDIPFNKITPSFLQNFQEKLEKDGLKKSSIGYIMRNIRTIINNNGKPYLQGDEYPFGRGKYVIPTGTGRNIDLKLSQVHLLQNYPCTGKTKLYRNLWIFSFYGNGLNIADLCRLRYSNILNDEFRFVRRKTQRNTNTEKVVIFPILEPIRDIIKKHGNKDKSGYVFPFINDSLTERQVIERINDVVRNINETVQSIAKKLKLPEGITTYSARHSFASIMENMNVPRKYISDSLGHANKSITEGYLGEYSREQRYNFNSKLLPVTQEDAVSKLIREMKQEMVYN